MTFDLTQSQLKDLLHYSIETGVFTWIKARGPMPVGRIAGKTDKKGYGVITINRKNYLSHRLAWLYVMGEFPAQAIDHINGIRSYNKFENLRLASQSQNNFNTGIKSTNTSGFKGVVWSKAANKWQAQSRVKGKNFYLGCYSTPELAYKAYQKHAMLNHGEFYKETS